MPNGLLLFVGLAPLHQWQLLQVDASHQDQDEAVLDRMGQVQPAGQLHGSLALLEAISAHRRR